MTPYDITKPADLCKESLIRKALESHGFHFHKQKGQNFLTTPWVTEQMAQCIPPNTAVLEIGPGFGALTAALAETGAQVTAVELDRRLLPILAYNLAAYPSVRIVEGDALRLDLGGLMPPDKPWMVCANLPYQITSPILAKLLESEAFNPLVVMIQHEVAMRLCARAGSREYGAFTVFVAMYAAVERMFSVPADCFIPKPQVESAVVRITRHKTPVGTDEERAMALKLCRAAFSGRRKTLANALSGGLGWPKDKTNALLAAADIDPMRRGETLSPEDYLRLAQTVLNR